MLIVVALSPLLTPSKPPSPPVSPLHPDLPLTALRQLEWLVTQRPEHIVVGLCVLVVAVTLLVKVVSHCYDKAVRS